MEKKPFDIATAIRRIRTAVKPWPKAALFELAENGFTNVNVLAGGIFNLRWRAANIKGKAALKDWVVNIPADNI